MSSREEMEAHVAQQAGIVRQLKKEKAPKEEIQAAVAELLARKDLLATSFPKEEEDTFNREGFEDLMKRRFFYAPAFEMYGGVAGLYDYGPSGCALLSNLTSEWRRHFVLEESMLEVSCPSLTPSKVLEASGHVERFADIMVRDAVTGDCHRADHLLEDIMAAKAKEAKTEAERKELELIGHMADTYSIEELKELFARFEIKSPFTGNDLLDPIEFNMMFKTDIGPTGDNPAFLRPETAQGIFLAFKRLYEFNNFRLPFAGAQIGTAYRNEISPRAGLLRVREFPLAEIEHFLDPEDKSNPKFATVRDIEVPLFSGKLQTAGKPAEKMTLGAAVDQGIIANETLGYFLGRIYLFAVSIGVDMERFRFRQHMPTEMAHYACDCWDGEMKTSYGWIECIGCADRSCYDLVAHAKACGKEIQASVPLTTPIVQDVVQCQPIKGVMGKMFKKDAKLLFPYLEGLNNDQVVELEQQLQAGEVTLTVQEKEFTITSEMVKIVRKQEKIFERKFVPGVIEPTFGLGRILYALLEHSFQVREGDEQRQWLKLHPTVAPVKCSLLPLTNNSEFTSTIDELSVLLTRANVSTRRDESGVSIGRRYARTDEIGIPFGITVDFDTLKDRTVTLRDRNSMQQIRLSMDEVASVVSDLSQGFLTWEAALAKYGLCQTGQEK
eukprot:m.353800 g.353800  ORF g.353800 m.353800 type:complete len:667 (-) comp16836_c0_seq1:181-2181(-)